VTTGHGGPGGSRGQRESAGCCKVCLKDRTKCVGGKTWPVFDHRNQ
jgi:hypothetical protein